MLIRKDKIKFFEEKLLDFFQKVGREHLPWREPRQGGTKRKKMTAYEVWVSEIMLQQTQVNRVIGYYTKFLKRFPTVESLAKVTWEEFLPYYEGLGYYSRGRNMLLAAQTIVTEYQGKFPSDKALLQTIPGIGPYTAAAIMSFAYGDNHLAWDTNLKRAIGRFFLGGKHLVQDEAFWEEKFEAPKKILNAALMDFGSAICVARPKCGICMLRSRCVYYREKGEKELRITNYELRKKKKGKDSHDWKQAQVMLYLHENHKKYFSAGKSEKSFQPFLLPAGYNTRAGIKEYFLKKHGLTLAVRPPHKKVVIKGKPTLIINAQILLGHPPFKSFAKDAIL